MLKAGSVTRLLTALSREAGVRKAYVQDVVARQAKMLQPLLCHPRCHVYICGSSNMAQEVCAGVLCAVCACACACVTVPQQCNVLWQTGARQLPGCLQQTLHPVCHPQVNVALGKVAGKPVIEAMAMEGR
jgi:hypothetical protein